MAPLVGQRVAIEGISAKPELNGQKGVAIGFDDGKGRYNVKLDSGAVVAIKPNNLQADRSAGGGGVPGMGDIPGMGGGMPGGMPGGGAAMPAMMLAQLMQRLRGMLPPGINPTHAALGAAAAFYAIRSSGVSLPLVALVGGGGAWAYRASRGAGLVTEARRAAEGAADAASRATGRPGSALQATIVGLATVALVGRYVIFAPSKSKVGGGDYDGAGGYAAYTKGYQDGQKGRPFDPIVDEGGGSASSGGGGFGLGSMLNLMIVGPMLYRMGGQPWSPQTFIASLKANPINAIMLLSMVSNWIF